VSSKSAAATPKKKEEKNSSRVFFLLSFIFFFAFAFPLFRFFQTNASLKTNPIFFYPCVLYPVFSPKAK